ncbi:MAG TPA: outer membrane protein assembly factor BamA [Steroidobacteraceae bacterium]|jgi:outer membrane protein insertion porin family
MRLGGARWIIIAAMAMASLSLWQAALASDLAIEVKGNRLVESDTIRSYFNPPGSWLDAESLDQALKALYATGLFEHVTVERRGDRVIVKVIENKIIKRVAFEGNKTIKDEQLKQETLSKERAPLASAVVQRDVQQIVDLYRRAGRFDAQVDPKIIDARDDQVDLVFAIHEGKKTGVRQISFVGNKAFKAAELRNKIKTGETNLLSFLLNNDIYDPDRIEQDRNLLHHFYLTRGYIDMRIVSADAQYDRDKNGIVVTFQLDEGERYRIGTAEIKSDLGTVDSAALQRRLRTQAGDIYNADTVEKSVDALSTDLAKAGQPFASVQPRLDRVPDRQTINVVYTIEQGARLYVERIDIHGNSKTEDRVIRREFDVAEGDAYNRTLIERGERRLKSLGYFKVVKVTKEPGSAPDRAIVNITVEEQGTGDFSISGGYSTADGILGQVSIGDKNFLGRGESVKASVTYGQYTSGFDLSLTEPYFLGSRASLGAALFDKQTTSSTYQAYDTLTYGARMTLGAPLSDELGAQLRYSIYNQQVTLDPASGIASLPIQQAALAGSQWVSSIGTGFTYSTLDDPRNPHNGVRAIINEDFAGLGGDVNFLRTTADLQYYHELANDVVGIVRAQGGYVTPWGGQQLPLLNNFFGGPQLVRGFAVNGFGPRDLTPGTTQDNIGGNIYWATTAEVQAPIPFMPPEVALKVAVFADAGSLWSTAGSSSFPALSQSLVGNSRTIRSSFGAGLVWDSMFGPIRVDYAYPISKASYDVTQRVHFGAGAFGF